MCKPLEVDEWGGVFKGAGDAGNATSCGTVNVKKCCKNSPKYSHLVAKRQLWVMLSQLSDLKYTFMALWIIFP